MPLMVELEAYQERLEERARKWDATSRVDLESDLARCDDQVGLLDKGIGEFEMALENMPDALRDERAKTGHRIAVLRQTRDLTEAYAKVLRGYLAGRAEA